MTTESAPLPYAVGKKSYTSAARESLLQFIQALTSEGNTESVKLPPETELAKQMGISRATLRQALTELELEGAVVRMQGKGTFVNKNYRPSGPFMEFLHLIEHEGYCPSCRLLDFRRMILPESLAQKLEQPAGTEAWQIDTVYYADDHLCIYCRDWIPAIYMRNTDDTKRIEVSFYDFLRRSTGKIGAYECSKLYAVSASEVDELFSAANILTCSAALVHESTLFCTDNLPLCFARSAYDTRYLPLHFFGKTMSL